VSFGGALIRRARSHAGATARRNRDLEWHLGCTSGFAMKKQTSRKLVLQTQTIRLLSGNALGQVVGGSLHVNVPGFIMKDTIIIRTSG
jgi:hypothetical protein